MTFVTRLLITLPILIVSIAIHEFSHAITADALGDPTPRRQGRLTLNPLAHLDQMGTLMIVMSSLAGFGIGWGKPVQVNPIYFRKLTPRAGMGVVAIAGPVSNILLAMIGSIGYHFAGSSFLAEFWFMWVLINLALAFFNLLPVFPLDGYNVFIAILDALRQPWTANLARVWQQQVQYGPLFLLLLLVIDWQMPSISPIRWLFGAPLQWALRLLGV